MTGLSAESHRSPLDQHDIMTTLRVLVVDPHVDHADTLLVLLGLWGFNGRKARTGPEALAAAVEFRPDLAVVEVSLPGEDGYAVACRLQALGIGVVILSARSGPNHQRRCREAGLAKVFTKPFDPDLLLDFLVGAAEDGK